MSLPIFPVPCPALLGQPMQSDNQSNCIWRELSLRCAPLLPTSAYTGRQRGIRQGSGRDLITGLVVGAELCLRFGLNLQYDLEEKAFGFGRSSVPTAAGAARIAGLNRGPRHQSRCCGRYHPLRPQGL